MTFFNKNSCKTFLSNIKFKIPRTIKESSVFNYINLLVAIIGIIYTYESSKSWADQEESSNYYKTLLTIPKISFVSEYLLTD